MKKNLEKRHSVIDWVIKATKKLDGQMK